MNKLTEIGRCKGCDRRSRLDAGVCPECLNSPKRGRKWAEMSHRCRKDPAFALACYNAIKQVSGKKIFEIMYGLPPGAVPPGRPALRLVRDEAEEEVRVALVMEA